MAKSQAYPPIVKEKVHRYYVTMGFSEDKPEVSYAELGRMYAVDGRAIPAQTISDWILRYGWDVEREKNKEEWNSVVSDEVSTELLRYGIPAGEELARQIRQSLKVGDNLLPKIESLLDAMIQELIDGKPTDQALDNDYTGDDKELRKSGASPRLNIEQIRSIYKTLSEERRKNIEVMLRVLEFDRRMLPNSGRTETRSTRKVSLTIQDESSSFSDTPPEVLAAAIEEVKKRQEAITVESRELPPMTDTDDNDPIGAGMKKRVESRVSQLLSNTGGELDEEDGSDEEDD